MPLIKQRRGLTSDVLQNSWRARQGATKTSDHPYGALVTRCYLASTDSFFA